MESKGGFALSGGRFAQVPGFEEARFREAPSVDRVVVADPMRIFPRRPADAGRDPRPFFLRAMKACGSSDIAPRYRRLRQFAAETGEAERERHFFAQELRARRFFFDRPFGEGRARFWFGWLYGGLSNFGRSFARPLLAWALSIPIFALAYLAARGTMSAAPAPLPSSAPPLPAWPQEANVHAIFEWMSQTFRWILVYVQHQFATGNCVSGDSNATAEAFFLSVKNALVFPAWESQDAVRRVYACLYGYESASGDPLLRVPLAVSSIALLQTVVSALLLLLVAIAFRNLLKTR